MELFWVMLSLDVSQCVGGIGETNVNTTKTSICGNGKRHVFDAGASGGAGDLFFTMTLGQARSQVFMCSTVGILTDLGNKGCDNLRTCYCFEMIGDGFVFRIGHHCVCNVWRVRRGQA